MMSHGIGRTMVKNEFGDHWLLDPEVIFLNHGSFGATPKAVLDEQEKIRRRIETEPRLGGDENVLQ